MPDKQHQAIGVVRLSKMTDETTSVARQKEIIERKAEERGAVIVGWAVDTDVSATKYAPTERPELRQWLDRPDAFDELIFWRLDRFVRKVRDLVDMIDWSRKHSKGLLSATESFDLEDPSGQGEAFAVIAALFASMETRATSIRVTGAAKYLRESGRWQGGNYPYGYRAIANPDGPGWVLVQDEHSADIAREAVRRVLAGEAVLSIATDYTKRGILCPQDYQRKLKDVPLRCVCKHELRDHDADEHEHQDDELHELGDAVCAKCDCSEYREYRQDWAPSSLFRVLRSQALLGRVLHNGKAVLGDDGMPLVRAEPLIDAATFTRLQAELTSVSKTRRRTQTPSELLNIAHCGSCGAPLFKWSKPNPRGIVYSYYRCRDNYKRLDDPGRCNAGPVPCGVLDDIFETELLAHAGGYMVTRLEVEPGDGHEAELAAVGQQIAELTQAVYVRGEDVPGFDQVMSRLRAEHKRLQSLPPSPDVIRRVETGQTMSDRMSEMTDTERRLWLRDSGVRVWARRGGLPVQQPRTGPLVPGQVPSWSLLTPADTSQGRLTDLYVMIDYGVLPDLLRRAPV